MGDTGAADPERAALWDMVRAGEADWSGESMVVPNDLPENDGQAVSDIVLEDRGPLLGRPGPRR